MKQGNNWTAERVARRVAALAEEHGSPNCFQLHEVANGVGSRTDILAISRIARLQWWAVNKALEGVGLVASYEVRQGPGQPARIAIEGRKP